jgi:hypothetical protein
MIGEGSALCNCPFASATKNCRSRVCVIHCCAARRRLVRCRHLCLVEVSTMLQVLLQRIGNGHHAHLLSHVGRCEPEAELQQLPKRQAQYLDVADPLSEFIDRIGLQVEVTASLVVFQTKTKLLGSHHPARRDLQQVIGKMDLAQHLALHAHITFLNRTRKAAEGGL